MALLFLSMAALAFIDLRPLVRDRAWREVVTFLILAAATLYLGILQVTGFQFPSAMLFIDAMLRRIGISY